LSEIISTKRKGDVAAITIDRADAGNMLTIELLRELASMLRACAASDAKVISLRTTGGDFCRGRDPKGSPKSPTALDMRQHLISPILEVYEAISGAPQPIVSAVQGAALGFGCALATACDITIAASTAHFRLPELEKNLPPTLAISAMMDRVPKKSLSWLVYSMTEIDAEAALRVGIVSSVVPSAELVVASDRLLADLCLRSRASLAAIKEYMGNAMFMRPKAAADYGGSLLAAVLSSG
jgi:enoyl-CoA hydratase